MGILNPAMAMRMRGRGGPAMQAAPTMGGGPMGAPPTGAPPIGPGGGPPPMVGGMGGSPPMGGGGMPGAFSGNPDFMAQLQAIMQGQGPGMSAPAMTPPMAPMSSGSGMSPVSDAERRRLLMGF